MSRVWVKLDATYTEDERVMAAGAMAELLFIRSICYCRRRVTDGHIPASALRMLAVGIDADPAVLAATLVEHELWLEVEGGWRLRSYDTWQQTREGLAADAARKRAERAERQREKKERDIGRTSSVRPSDTARTSTDCPQDGFVDVDFVTATVTPLRDLLKANHA